METQAPVPWHLKPYAPELADGSSTRVDDSSHDPGPEGRDSTDVEDEEPSVFCLLLVGEANNHAMSQISIHVPLCGVSSPPSIDKRFILLPVGLLFVMGCSSQSRCGSDSGSGVDLCGG